MPLLNCFSFGSVLTFFAVPLEMFESPHCEKENELTYSYCTLTNCVIFSTGQGCLFLFCELTLLLLHSTTEIPNPCEPNPCENGGSCFSEGTRYRCTCEEGFTGRHCETGKQSILTPVHSNHIHVATRFLHGLQESIGALQQAMTSWSLFKSKAVG